MQLSWGNIGQITFASEEEYYTSLGIFANSKLARVYIEDNAKRGSFTDAKRLLLYAETRRANIPDALRKAMKDGGRINCNEYVDNLLENHGFVLSGNVVVTTLENVLKSIPENDEKNITAFMKGYYLLQNVDAMNIRRITYSTESIDVSDAKLVRKDIPHKISSLSKMNGKVGKRDYIKLAINEFEIGEAGEKIVYEYEKRKLIKALKEGKISSLKNKLEWVSRIDDSVGYDIRSYNVDKKQDMYIEVKTTTGSEITPFYLSESELQISKELKEQYYLYRLYKMDRYKPQEVEFYIINGDIAESQDIKIENQGYKATIKKEKN